MASGEDAAMARMQQALICAAIWPVPPHWRVAGMEELHRGCLCSAWKRELLCSVVCGLGL